MGPTIRKSPTRATNPERRARRQEQILEAATELFAQRESEIRDQIRTIVASSDPISLAEPGLNTLRRKISFKLDETMGKDLIKEVLIPKCTPQPGQ